MYKGSSLRLTLLSKTFKTNPTSTTLQMDYPYARNLLVLVNCDRHEIPFSDLKVPQEVGMESAF
jgi:hypothetical protein